MRCAIRRHVLIAGIMEHIEEAGVHRAIRAACCPPCRCRRTVIETIRAYTEQLARALNVIGLMNVQYAMKDGNGLRARSESARLAHRAVRQQSDRRSAAENRRRA